MTPKEITLQALTNAKGDDLERAQMAFRGYSEKELDTQHGMSGKTRREILEGYQKYRNQINQAIEWVNSHK